MKSIKDEPSLSLELSNTLRHCEKTGKQYIYDPTLLMAALIIIFQLTISFPEIGEAKQPPPF